MQAAVLRYATLVQGEASEAPLSTSELTQPRHAVNVEYQRVHLWSQSTRCKVTTSARLALR